MLLWPRLISAPSHPASGRPLRTLRLIALAANEDETSETPLAAEAGIVGFVGRDQTLDSVAAAIFAVVKGEAIFAATARVHFFWRGFQDATAALPY